MYSGSTWPSGALYQNATDSPGAKIALLIGIVLPDVTVMLTDAGCATVSVSTGISSVLIVPWYRPTNSPTRAYAVSGSLALRLSFFRPTGRKNDRHQGVKSCTNKQLVGHD